VLGASYVVLQRLTPDCFIPVAATDARESSSRNRINEYELRILASDKVLSVNDRNAPGVDPIQRTIMESIGVHASLGMRLYAHDHPLGILFVNQDTPRVWRDHERELVQRFALEIAYALENKRLLDESRRQLEELRSLARVGSLISAAVPPDTALYAVAGELARVFAADYVGLHIRQGENLRLIAESE